MEYFEIYLERNSETLELEVRVQHPTHNAYSRWTIAPKDRDEEQIEAMVNHQMECAIAFRDTLNKWVDILNDPKLLEQMVNNLTSEHDGPTTD